MCWTYSGIQYLNAFAILCRRLFTCVRLSSPSQIQRKATGESLRRMFLSKLPLGLHLSMRFSFLCFFLSSTRPAEGHASLTRKVLPCDLPWQGRFASDLVGMRDLQNRD